MLNFKSRCLDHIAPLNEDEARNVLLVDYSDNAIARLEHLDSFSNVQQLNLSGNLLCRINGISKLSRLQRLDLARNRIQATDGIQGLYSLQFLVLADNQIQKLGNLAGLTSLVHLDLSRNMLQILPNFSQLVSLKTLILTGNRIVTLEQCASYLPKSIFSFDLSLNRITDMTQFSFLSHFDSLESVMVTENPCLDFSTFKEGFNHRPYLLCCSLHLKTIDNFLVTESELLKGEWLCSMGKGRQFGPGQHSDLCNYLASTCPMVQQSNKLQTEEEKKMKKVMAKRKQYLSESVSEIDEQTYRTTSSPVTSSASAVVVPTLDLGGKPTVKKNKNNPSPAKLGSKTIVQSADSDKENSKIKKNGPKKKAAAKVPPRRRPNPSQYRAEYITQSFCEPPKIIDGKNPYLAYENRVVAAASPSPFRASPMQQPIKRRLEFTPPKRVASQPRPQASSSSSPQYQSPYTRTNSRARSVSSPNRSASSASSSHDTSFCSTTSSIRKQWGPTPSAPSLKVGMVTPALTPKSATSTTGSVTPRALSNVSEERSSELQSLLNRRTPSVALAPPSSDERWQGRWRDASDTSARPKATPADGNSAATRIQRWWRRRRGLQSQALTSHDGDLLQVLHAQSLLRIVKLEQWVNVVMRQLLGFETANVESKKTSEGLMEIVKQLWLEIQSVKNDGSAAARVPVISCNCVTEIHELKQQISLLLPKPSGLSFVWRSETSGLLSWHFQLFDHQKETLTPIAFQVFVDDVLCGEVKNLKTRAMITELDRAKTHRLHVKAIFETGVTSYASSLLHVQPTDVLLSNRSEISGSHMSEVVAMGAVEKMEPNIPGQILVDTFSESALTDRTITSGGSCETPPESPSVTLDEEPPDLATARLRNAEPPGSFGAVDSDCGSLGTMPNLLADCDLNEMLTQRGRSSSTPCLKNTDEATGDGNQSDPESYSQSPRATKSDTRTSPAGTRRVGRVRRRSRICARFDNL